MIKVLSPLKDNLNEFAKMGNYAYSLAYMKQSNNVNVSDFICFPNDTCYSFLGEIKTNILKYMSRFKNNEMSAIDASTCIQKEIESIIFPSYILEELGTCINTYLNALPADTFEIKTAIYWENIGNGQSYFEKENIVHKEVPYSNIAIAILTAFGSVYSPNVLNKLKEKNFEIDFPKNNIVIQKKIHPSIYGTAIPYDETNQIINETIIIANMGDSINKDELKNENNIDASEIEIKEIYHYNGSDGKYYNEKLSNYELLSKKDIIFLMKQVNFLNNIMYNGQPIAVSFAIENGITYITSAIPCNVKQNEKNTLYNGSCLENIEKNGTSILTYSYWKHLFQKNIKDLYCNKLPMDDIYTLNENYFNESVKFINNCIYIVPEYMSVFVRLLPYSKVLFPLWLNETKLANPHYKIIEPIYPNKGKNKNFAKTQKSNEKIIVNLLSDKENINATINNFLSQLSMLIINKPFYNFKSIQELLKFMFEIENNYINISTYKFLIKSYITTIEKELKEKLIKANIDEKVIDKLLFETKSNQETTIDKEIYKLSSYPARNEIIGNILYQIKNNDDVDMFLSSNPNEEFIQQINNFLINYGYLTINTIKLEELTIEENTMTLISAILKKYEHPNKSNICFEHIDLSKTLTKKGIKEIYENLNNYCFILNELYLLDIYYYSFIKNIFIVIGEVLFTNKKIDDKLDIYHIDYQTLLNIINNKNNNFDIKTLIRQNENEYNKKYHIPTFNELIFNF